MQVKSMFDFKFPAKAQAEGITVAEGVGNDMPAKDGYLSHEVVQDVKDPGHLMVNTLWQSQEQSEAVLGDYQHDAKIKRATELIGSPPSGFTGSIRAAGE